jgi:hypothetical protein
VQVDCVQWQFGSDGSINVPAVSLWLAVGVEGQVHALLPHTLVAANTGAHTHNPSVKLNVKQAHTR